MRLLDAPCLWTTKSAAAEIADLTRLRHVIVSDNTNGISCD